MQAKFWEKLNSSEILVVLKSPTAKIDFIDFLKIEAAFLKTNYITFNYWPITIHRQNNTLALKFWPVSDVWTEKN